MLSGEKHCEMLSDNARDKSAAINDNFKLFIQLFSGLVGGSVVIRLQYGEKTPTAFASLTDWLGALIVIACAILILDAFRSWYGYRRRLSERAGNNTNGIPVVPTPSLLLSARTVTVMMLVMAVALVAFLMFNPLKIPN